MITHHSVTIIILEIAFAYLRTLLVRRKAQCRHTQPIRWRDLLKIVVPVGQRL